MVQIRGPRASGLERPRGWPQALREDATRRRVVHTPAKEGSLLFGALPCGIPKEGSHVLEGQRRLPEPAGRCRPGLWGPRHFWCAGFGAAGLEPPPPPQASCLGHLPITWFPPQSARESLRPPPGPPSYVAGNPGIDVVDHLDATPSSSHAVPRPGGRAQTLPFRPWSGRKPPPSAR